jgi:ABC-type ATPase involved in cell division
MQRNFTAKDNPFTLQFSYIPPQYITRKALTEEIVNDLERNVPTFRCHFLTGVRGSGKSVLMAEIANTMENKDGWIVVDIPDPTDNIIDALARGLCRVPELRLLFTEAKIDVSVLGINFSVEKADYIASNGFDAIDIMLKVLKKKNKRVLVTIDEVTYNNEIGSFSHSLSSYARAGYEIYVIMTGLKENIKAIKNDKSLTFLYRAKEHELEPLNITSIIATYSKVFNISREVAETLAWLTKGYSFAFQVIGYIYWNALTKNSEIKIEDLLPEVDQYLAEFSYDKIWAELAPTEKKAVIELSCTESGKVSEVRERLNMDSQKFGVYRERLIDKGIIDGKEYGILKIKLPRFGEYAKLHGAVQ